MLSKDFEEIEVWEKIEDSKSFRVCSWSVLNWIFYSMFSQKAELKAREGTLWLRLQFTSLKLKTVWFSINSIGKGLATCMSLLFK